MIRGSIDGLLSGASSVASWVKGGAKYAGRRPGEYINAPLSSAGRAVGGAVASGASAVWKHKGSIGSAAMMAGVGALTVGASLVMASPMIARVGFAAAVAGTKATGRGIAAVANNPTFRAYSASGAYFAGGTALKGMGEEYQKTPGFENHSKATQMLISGGTLIGGTLMQARGVLGGTATTARAFGYTPQADLIQRGARLIGRAGLKAGYGATVGTAKMLGRAAYGGAESTAAVGLGAARTAIYGPKAGLISLHRSVSNMKHPYLGSMALGGLAGGSVALMKPNKEKNLTPRTAGNMQGMNRSNYNRVSKRARRMGV